MQLRVGLNQKQVVVIIFLRFIKNYKTDANLFVDFLVFVQKGQAHRNMSYSPLWKVSPFYHPGKLSILVLSMT